MYKITIQKIERKEEIQQGEWGVLETRPYTKKEMESSYNTEDYKGHLKEIRGYRPDVKKVKRLEVTILEQSVEELDLTEVIKAINNID